VTAAEYHRMALDALPSDKRLPVAVYLLDPGDDPRVPSLIRITVAELRKRLEIGPEFNLLKFHTASSPSSTTAPARVISSCFSRNVSSPKDHQDRSKMNRFSAKLRKLGLRAETIGYGPTKEKWEAWNGEPT
jgi:hypothetical protein